jgi:hypothetical protein
MNEQRKIPDAQTRARSVAKLQELVKQWDRLIVDIDELNTRLEADIQKSPLTAYRLKRMQRMAQSEEKQE